MTEDEIIEMCTVVLSQVDSTKEDYIDFCDILLISRKVFMAPEVKRAEMGLRLGDILERHKKELIHEML